MFNRYLATAAIVATTLIAPFLGTARADASPANDRAFIYTLDSEGIIYTTEGDALRAGEAVCQYLDLGYDAMETVTLVVDASGLGWYQAGYFVGASIAAFCSEYADLIPGQAQGRYRA